MGERAATKGCTGGFRGARRGHELIVTGIDRLDSRPGGGSYPALLGGEEMAKDQSIVGAHTFASRDGGAYTMLTIDWFLAS